MAVWSWPISTEMGKLGEYRGILVRMEGLENPPQGNSDWVSGSVPREGG